jgi:hypothetical protein
VAAIERIGRVDRAVREALERREKLRVLSER